MGEAAIGKKEHGSLALVQGHIEVGNSRFPRSDLSACAVIFTKEKGACGGNWFRWDAECP